MKIKELIEAVWNKQQQVYRDQRAPRNIHLCVYMTPRHMSECMNEIRGEVSPAIMEFYDKRTIFGHKVHCVTDEKDHPPYRIVNLDE